MAATSTYDMSRVMARGYCDAMTPGLRAAALEAMSRRRSEDAASGGAPKLAGAPADTLDGIDGPALRMSGPIARPSAAVTRGR